MCRDILRYISSREVERWRERERGREGKRGIGRERGGEEYRIILWILCR